MSLGKKKKDFRIIATVHCFFFFEGTVGLERGAVWTWPGSHRHPLPGAPARAWQTAAVHRRASNGNSAVSLLRCSP